MLAGSAIAQPGGSPLSRSRLTRCGGTAAATAISSTVNTPSRQNTGPRRCAARLEGVAAPAAGAAAGRGRGAPRSSHPCSGTHSSRLMAPSTQEAWRQPPCAISQAVSGMNTVLASPPRKVSVMMARRNVAGKRRVTTANTGGYSVAAMPAPSSVHTT